MAVVVANGNDWEWEGGGDYYEDNILSWERDSYLAMFCSIYT